MGCQNPNDFNICKYSKAMKELIDIARQTVDAIRKRVENESRNKFGTEIGMGADGTPTLYIDKIAEEIAMDVIGKKANILSEEAGFVDNDADYTMVIDPVDGTRNAVHGIPFYCVSIGIGKRDGKLNEIEYGIVKNLATGDVYEAFKGKGAYLNGNKIEVSKNHSDIIFVLTLGESGNEKTWRKANMHTIRAMGAAALEMCLVASGAAHAYFMPKESLRVTDFAAGCLIVREAGGEVYNSNGEILNVPYSLNVRSSVLAVSDDMIMEALL